MEEYPLKVVLSMALKVPQWHLFFVTDLSEVCVYVYVCVCLTGGLIAVSPNAVMFCKKYVREGVLPRMLSEILATRIMVKNSMSDAAKHDKVCAWASFSICPGPCGCGRHMGECF